MRMEDGQLVALVLEEPDGGIDVELVAVRGLEPVPAAHVPLGDVVLEDEHAAALVRRLFLRVRAQLRPDRGWDYHHSTASSISSPVQKGAERYFQPPSASSATTTASSGSSSAMRRATCTAAPADTPANRPSPSSRTRAAAAASALETRSLRSSCATSRIGGT